MSEFDYQEGQDAARWSAIAAVADALVAIGEPVWQQGDGAGGGVLQEVYEAAQRRGLRMNATYRGPR